MIGIKKDLNQKYIVAFLLPVFNAESSIEKTINCLLKQNYPHFKIYILSNGCTDRTNEIIAKYSNSDKRIEIHFLKEANLSKALCYGLQVIKEEFVMRIDSGDITDINRVSKTLAFMKKNKDCDIAYSDWYLQDGATKKLNILPFKILKEDLIYRNKIAHSTICFRKSIFEEYNFNYSGIGNLYLYFGPTQDLLLISISKFIFNLNIEKIPDTFSEVTMDIKDSISLKNRIKQSRIALRILLINNLKLIKESNNFFKKIKSLSILIIIIFRFLKYNESPRNIFKIFYLSIRKLSDKLIYQKIANLYFL
jgi:glycosyltransferase involved in cell wall biosynthesis